MRFLLIFLNHNNMKELEEKIYNGEKLTEYELCEAVSECDVVDEIIGDDGRWTHQMTTIIQVKDKLFAINWERGLTECQDSMFSSQPYEVVKKTRVVAKGTYYVTK